MGNGEFLTADCRGRLAVGDADDLSLFINLFASV